MRKWLNEDVLPRLPKELQAMIVPRTIRQKINGEEVQTQDKLWLPSFTEMFGAKAAAERAPSDLGDEQFELFDSERSRVKEVPGRGTWRGLRLLPLIRNLPMICTPVRVQIGAERSARCRNRRRTIAGV